MTGDWRGSWEPKRRRVLGLFVGPQCNIRIIIGVLSEMDFMTVQFRWDFWAWGIKLRFLRLEVLSSFLPFYKMLFMYKLEFSSIIDCFAWISCGGLLTELAIIGFTYRNNAVYVTDFEDACMIFLTFLLMIKEIVVCLEELFTLYSTKTNHKNPFPHIKSIQTF